MAWPFLLSIHLGALRLKYDEPEAGDWIQPVRKGYKMACCDCGLVHTINFRIKDKRVQFQVFRNNRSTAMVRRHMKEIPMPCGKSKGKKYGGKPRKK